jgi:hypothetical protein
MTGPLDTNPHPEPNVRRWFAAGCVVSLLMLIVVVALFAFPLLVGSGCGCAATPSPRPPGWTPTPPPPVSPSDAAARASKFAGVSMEPSPDWTTVAGRPISEPTGNGAIGFVDGDTGAVLEVVMENQLPVSDATSASADAARGAAETVLARGGVTTVGLTESAKLVRRASVAFYDLTWSEPGAAIPALEVLVNSSSGAVFAYRDLRSGVDLSAPVFGYAAAASLARASSYASGETPDAAGSVDSDMQVDLGSPDGHMWTWTVVFPDGVLFVDAETGDVWIGKWGAR